MASPTGPNCSSTDFYGIFFATGELGIADSAGAALSPNLEIKGTEFPVELFPKYHPDAFWKAFSRWIGRFLSCLLHTHEGKKNPKLQFS